MDIGSVTEQRFIHDVLENLKVRTILERWDDLGLPDGWLVAGCLFQTVWNVLSGLEAESRIKDYDLFYFEPADLSEAAENAVQRRVECVLGDLQVPVEAKNQARVHLWYEEQFGYPYPVLANSREGIDRFLITATCVGIRSAQNGLEVYAPNDLSLMYAGLLQPNPLTDHKLLFRAKAASYRERWSWLTVVETERT
jgi:hypothetical protein